MRGFFRWSWILIGSLGSFSAMAADEEVAVVKTSYGEIVWRFLPEAAPGHVAFVKELIRTRFYDGTTFHRVIPWFVIQGGDPNSRNADRGDDGEGEATRRLKGEFTPGWHYRPGSVGMARDVDPDSGSCQFFIALENLPRLDGRYTIFGEVIAGLEVAREIALVPRDQRDNPLQAVRVTVTLEKREVPETILSREPGPSGEVLTGPGKPKPFDPGNRFWQPPRLETAPGTLPPARLELVVGEDGRVLDLRFPLLETPGADRLAATIRTWRFQPALFAGQPVKTRLEIDSDGSDPGPPSGPDAPREAGGMVTGPIPAPRVVLPPGQTPPAKATRLRLTIDATGAVTEVSIQESCGDATLDERAVAAARELVFSPATRAGAPGKPPDPVPVYLNVETRFQSPS